MRPRIILEGKNMSNMTTEEQEYWWRLSRTNDVFEVDCNGELWQILDLCTDEKEHCGDN